MRKKPKKHLLKRPAAEAAEPEPAQNAETTEEAAEPAEENNPWTPIPVVQAWADYEQPNGDFVIVNAIDDKPETGWGLESNKNPGNSRQAIFLLANPIGAEGGVLRIRLKHESEHAKHHFGRFRFAVTDVPTIYPMGSKVSLGNWHSVGPFTLRNTVILPSTTFMNRRPNLSIHRINSPLVRRR